MEPLPWAPRTRAAVHSRRLRRIRVLGQPLRPHRGPVVNIASPTQERHISFWNRYQFHGLLTNVTRTRVCTRLGRAEGFHSAAAECLCTWLHRTRRKYMHTRTTLQGRFIRTTTGPWVRSLRRSFAAATSVRNGSRWRTCDGNGTAT